MWLRRGISVLLPCAAVWMKGNSLNHTDVCSCVLGESSSVNPGERCRVCSQITIYAFLYTNCCCYFLSTCGGERCIKEDEHVNKKDITGWLTQAETDRDKFSSTFRGDINAALCEAVGDATWPCQSGVAPARHSSLLSTRIESRERHGAKQGRQGAGTDYEGLNKLQALPVQPLISSYTGAPRGGFAPRAVR